MAGKLLVAACLVALCAGMARAADPCSPTLNFFPTADQIGAPQLINNKTCKGDTVCNFPAVWQQKNQSAYTTKLQTTLEDGLFKVAFKQYGNEKPRLFFTPISAFLAEGSDVTECAQSRVPVPATRRLQQAEGQRYSVATAGEWSYSVSYDGAPAQEGDQIAGKSGQLDPLELNKDGEHCANITVTVTGLEVSPALPGFPSRFSSVQTVCWYRMSQQAKAQFEFDMCTTQQFTVNISNIAPLPQQLSQNGSSVVVNGKQAMLFRPVIHLFGRKNRTLNGEVIKELEYDTMNNPINFINRYIMLPANTTGNDTFSFVLDEDSLDEGYYKLSAKVALVSQFPDLVDLDGRTNIIQADSYGEDVRGFVEYSGVTVINETSMVGVQKSKTTLSAITSDKLNQNIQSGEPITFFWQFAGIGQERCFHDDVEIPDCASGVIVQANDVSHNSQQHTFRVEFTDVCGNSKQAEYSYTQQGVQAVSKEDYIPVVTDNLSLPAAASKQPRNSAAAAKPAGVLAVLLVLLAAALL
ncbi:hypothetical protein OEZ85_013277 [Tetradesmus obliquus]|uniref:Uncharacterized protein n=1 Tax=Tetradesmus obliquus TaxID=3088 RepID=A0ABY8U5X1_TETOB|nr:hypothetical protein OEZ85_013277 [Tetradesmus obliquus]